MRTGRQLAAALALGAEGVNCGTRFMATQEAAIHPSIKQALVCLQRGCDTEQLQVDGDENATTLVMRSLKNTERVYKNKVAQEVRDIEAAKPGPRGLAQSR